jgi:hypothetical protein
MGKRDNVNGLKAEKKNVLRIDLKNDGVEPSDCSRESDVDEDSEKISISSIDLQQIVSKAIATKVDELKSELCAALSSLTKDITTRFEFIEQMIASSDIKNKIDTVDKNTILLNNNVSDIKDLISKMSDNLCTPVTKDVNVQKNDTAPAACSITMNSLDDALLEIKEREQKKDNVIIFNMQESKDTTVQTRIDHDKTVYKSICETIGVSDHDIKSIYRIGRFDPIKSRPVVVKTCTATKLALLTNARMLKNHPNEKWVIKPDLTKKEQEIEKTMFAEFKQRRDAGEKVFLRNGKIIIRNEAADTT